MLAWKINDILLLRYEKARGGSQNLNSTKVRQWPEILSGEFGVKLSNNSVNKGGVTTYSNHIISIDHEVDKGSAAEIDIKRQVYTGCNKVESKKVRSSWYQLGELI